MVRKVESLYRFPIGFDNILLSKRLFSSNKINPKIIKNLVKKSWAFLQHLVWECQFKISLFLPLTINQIQLLSFSLSLSLSFSVCISSLITNFSKPFSFPYYFSLSLFSSGFLDSFYFTLSFSPLHLADAKRNLS